MFLEIFSIIRAREVFWPLIHTLQKKTSIFFFQNGNGSTPGSTNGSTSGSGSSDNSGSISSVQTTLDRLSGQRDELGELWYE